RSRARREVLSFPTRRSSDLPALRALRGALLLDRGRGGALGRGTRARARGVRAGRTGRRRGTGGAAAARRSGARRGGPLARGSGGSEEHTSELQSPDQLACRL